MQFHDNGFTKYKHILAKKLNIYSRWAHSSVHAPWQTCKLVLPQMHPCHLPVSGYEIYDKSHTAETENIKHQEYQINKEKENR